MYRIGIGEDIHRTNDARPLVLGGVIIEEGPGLSGHSDADVLLHAVTDAILGAAALGDIGSHFPPSDARWAGADSADFARTAATLVRQAGWEIANVDATVRAERPRLSPYIQPIRMRLAEVLTLAPAAVSVKAKSSEGLDAVGRGEAIAATAAVLLRRS